MIKYLDKLGSERTLLKIMAIYNNPTAIIIFHDETLKKFPLKKVQDKDVHSLHFYSI